MSNRLALSTDRQAGGRHGHKQWRCSRRQGAPVTGPAGQNKASKR